MREWLYNRVPTGVALLGGFGLGTTLTYFFGMYLALVHGGFPGWSAFFVSWAPLLMMVPAVSLVAYLMVRSRVGDWLVDRRAYDAAIRFTSERLHAGLLRSEDEAWLHRRALVRAQLAGGNLKRADELLQKIHSEEGSPESVRPDWYAWKMEIAARDAAESQTENFEVTLDRIEALEPKSANRTMARMWAVAAEMVARDQLQAVEGLTAGQLISRARACLESWSRIDVAEAVVLTLTSGDREAWEHAKDLLTGSMDEVLTEMPVRKAELEALVAELLARLDERDRAAELLNGIDEDVADPVGRTQVQRVKERYGIS